MHISRSSVIQLLVLLHSIRYSHPHQACFALGQFVGYVNALWDVDVIPLEVKKRLDDLAFNAYGQFERREA